MLVQLHITKTQVTEQDSSTSVPPSVLKRTMWFYLRKFFAMLMILVILSGCTEEVELPFKSGRQFLIMGMVSNIDHPASVQIIEATAVNSPIKQNFVQNASVTLMERTAKGTITTYPMNYDQAASQYLTVLKGIGKVGHTYWLKVIFPGEKIARSTPIEIREVNFSPQISVQEERIDRYRLLQIVIPQNMENSYSYLVNKRDNFYVSKKNDYKFLDEEVNSGPLSIDLFLSFMPYYDSIANTFDHRARIDIVVLTDKEAENFLRIRENEYISDSNDAGFDQLFAFPPVEYGTNFVSDDEIKIIGYFFPTYGKSYIYVS